MSDNYDKILLRQLKKKNISLDVLSPEVLSLLDTVNETYRLHKKEMILLNRAMELSSGELSLKNKELLKASELSKEFSFIVAHNLKEPLRTIGSFTQLLQLKNVGKIDTECQEYFDFIQEGVNRMSNYLRDLMSYLVLDNAEDKIEDVDLNALIETCMRDLSIKIKESNTIINSSNLYKLKVHPGHFIQLFQNLFTNSIKFKRENINPQITVSNAIEDDKYKIFISDNGIGIEAEYKEKIFGLFNRLSTKNEGTGIGLSICKRVTDFYNGKIYLDEEYNDGTKFIIELPASILAN